MGSGELNTGNPVQTHMFWLENNDTLRLRNSSVSTTLVISGTEFDDALPLNTWVCLAATFDIVSNEMSIYGDSGTGTMELLAQNDEGFGIPESDSGGDGRSIRLGGWSNKNGEDGDLQEFQHKAKMYSLGLYERELSLSEIQKYCTQFRRT